jgi:hypothetical protein
MDDLCKCGHEMKDHRDGLGCEDCMCGGFVWPVRTLNSGEPACELVERELT